MHDIKAYGGRGGIIHSFLISPLAGRDRGLLVASLGHLSDNGWVSVASQAAEGQTISCVRPRSVCSYNSCVPGAEDKPYGSSVESGPRYPGSMSVCGAAQWSKLSESWSKFKFTDFHVMVLHSPITGPRCPEGSRKLTFPDYVIMA